MSEKRSERVTPQKRVVQPAPDDQAPPIPSTRCELEIRKVPVCTECGKVLEPFHGMPSEVPICDCDLYLEDEGTIAMASLVLRPAPSPIPDEGEKRGDFNEWFCACHGHNDYPVRVVAKQWALGKGYKPASPSPDTEGEALPELEQFLRQWGLWDDEKGHYDRAKLHAASKAVDEAARLRLALEEAQKVAVPILDGLIDDLRFIQVEEGKDVKIHATAVLKKLREAREALSSHPSETGEARSEQVKDWRRSLESGPAPEREEPHA